MAAAASAAASQVSSCVTPPFVYVHPMVWNTKVTSSSGGSVEVAGTMVSGTNCLMLAMRPCLMATV